MGSEIMNAVTIYEMNGIKYTGAQKIYFTPHPRFLSFVRLCIDNQEYSLGADDLMRSGLCYGVACSAARTKPYSAMFSVWPRS
jgi:hypothetical protein